jgi:hypothetical protein
MRGRFFKYSIANLAVIAPVLSAIFVVIVSRYVIVLPEDCPDQTVVVASAVSRSAEAQRGNPFFCKRKEWVELIRTAFAKSFNAIHEDVNGFEATPDPGRRIEDRARDLAKLTYDTEEQRLSGWNQAALYGEVASSLKSWQTVAEQDLWNKLAAVSREAKARITWIGAICLQIVITFAAIAGSIWIISTSVEEQSAMPAPQQQAPESYLIYLLIFVLVAIIALLLISLIVDFSYELLINNSLLPPPFWPLFPAIEDNLSRYVKELLMPGVAGLVKVANNLFSWVGIPLLVLAVSSTLLQRPEERDSRKRRLPARPHARDFYQEFLTRCFERLKVALYVGAIMLVVYVTQLNAWYAWPVSLLSPAADTEPLGRFGKAIADLSSQLGLEYGLVFTVLLAAIYLPALVILRRRAWQLARSRNPGSDMGAQQEWLAKRNLSISLPSGFLQAVALLSPAVVGSLLTLFQLPGGK